MQVEIEAKWLDINPDEFRENLQRLGAKQIHPERLMRRMVFDYPDSRLEKIGGWVRVRDEGDKITFSYKQLNDRSLHGTQEVETTVGDFEKTGQLLKAIGLIQRSYQETRREKWVLGDCEVTIDTWPWIPTFVELEAPREELLRTSAEKTGLNWDMAMHGSVETAYQKYYDFTEHEIDNWPEITFVPEPDWLLAKKKQPQG
ncbi:MAG: class IV adenylate cyclase [Candidatus Berkelbacteria bacterium]|nr:MAG: class IV adenylate cyclase [Candidatus Berkelbacteria bacterium]QQG51800.1 MAG: class IV adenylate cyclase [Candidatus Berkelbacteria bacterium]